MFPEISQFCVVVDYITPAPGSSYHWEKRYTKNNLNIKMHLCIAGLEVEQRKYFICPALYLMSKNTEIISLFPSGKSSKTLSSFKKKSFCQTEILFKIISVKHFNDAALNIHKHRT